MTFIGKKHQQRCVPLTAKLSKELCEYRIFAERWASGLPEFVFTDSHGEKLTEKSLKCIFKRLNQIMNFKGVRLSAHTFRHTFAVRWSEEGMDRLPDQPDQPLASEGNASP